MIIQELQLAHLIPLLKGAWLTIVLCFFSVLFGGLLGLFIGFGAISKQRFIRNISNYYVQVIRGVPLLMLIFLIYFGLPLLTPSLGLSQGFAAVISLSIYASAYIGEFVRGAILSVDKGQFEAADALGLNYWQKTIHVIFPQAFKFMLPPGIGFIIALIKDSSLVSVIGFIELTKAGRIVSNLTFNPILVFTIVAAIYFIICYTLSKVANRFEVRNMNYTNS